MKSNRIVSALFVLVLIAGSASAQTNRETTLYPDITPQRTVYLQDGRKLAEVSLNKEGQVVKQKIYYGNGRLAIEENYLDGLLSGARKCSYKDGHFFAEENYAGGKLNGTRQLYYQGGKLALWETYRDGLLDGVCQSYYDDGKLKIVEGYRNGVNYQGTRWYYPSGQLKRELIYKGGTLPEEITVLEYAENSDLTLKKVFRQVEYTDFSEKPVVPGMPLKIPSEPAEATPAKPAQSQNLQWARQEYRAALAEHNESREKFYIARELTKLADNIYQIYADNRPGGLNTGFVNLNMVNARSDALNDQAELKTAEANLARAERRLRNAEATLVAAAAPAGK